MKDLTIFIAGYQPNSKSPRQVVVQRLFRTYINNLSLLGHDFLFRPTFEKLFTEFIPLFNYTLADPGYRDRSWDWNRYSAPQWSSCGYDLQNEVGWRDLKTLAQRRLEGKTVKVMTRLLKISLLSEDAHYPGDEWHVDGMMNEFRVATGIYNYAKENITDFSLRIRHQNYYHTMPYYDGIRPLRIVDDYAPALMKVEIITSWKLKANSSPDPSL
ncbi:hypothetical protein TWF970_007052 [Orbilia oligospora]|uniref:DUF4246 domain-containing protein n=1 Tax=Orbilia oligospora TaxID=2813651 RepID=A0A7C8REW8_ORBOL|nr:hypothetical protein TWF970_007052 [Orbilia oligospora]